MTYEFKADLQGQIHKFRADLQDQIYRLELQIKEVQNTMLRWRIETLIVGATAILSLLITSLKL